MLASTRRPGENVTLPLLVAKVLSVGFTEAGIMRVSVA
jgi:hypothetical protein